MEIKECSNINIFLLYFIQYRVVYTTCSVRLLKALQTGQRIIAALLSLIYANPAIGQLSSSREVRELGKHT